MRGESEYRKAPSKVPYMHRGDEMTLVRLMKLIGWHKTVVQQTLKPLMDLYEVDPEIFRKKPNDDGKPDNRIASAHCKIVVDEFVGYLCGVPVKIASPSEAATAYLDYLEAATAAGARTAELLRLSAIYGTSFEMYYNGEDGEQGAVALPPTEAFMVYDDTILHRPMYFVRYGVGADNVERGSWSDGSVVQHFTLSPVLCWDGEPEAHYFPDIPATEYAFNTDRIGLFEPGVSLANAFNAAISEKANDIDAFADAYMEITGAPVDASEIPFIKRTRIINFQGNGDGTLPRIGFLERPTADGLEEHFLDRVETLFFRACQVPDLSNEHFGTASGEALKWRLLAMDNLAATVRRQMEAAMARRHRILFGTPLAVSRGVGGEDWAQLSYYFSRNLPTNVTDEAAAARALDGITSRATQLKVLSVVDSVPDELDRIEAERRAEMEAAMTLVNEEHDHEKEKVGE